MTKLTSNEFLKTEKLQPQGTMILVRIDEPGEKTKGGLVLPSMYNTPEYANMKPSDRMMDWTAVVLKCGDEVETCKVGERVLLPFPPIPVPVLEDEKFPLGVLDSRDIQIKVS